MKRILFSLLIALSLYGCFDDFRIYNDVRLYSSGVVTDSEGNALQGIPIAIKDVSALLGSTVTKADGSFEFVGLKSNAEVLEVLVNENNNDEYQGIVFKSFNTDINDLSLGQVTLQSTAQLNFSITNSGNQSEDLIYSLTYVFLRGDMTCDQVLTGTLDPENSFNFFMCGESQTFENTIDANTIETSEQVLNSFRGSTVLFQYRFGENGPLNNVEIPLNNPQNDYSFEY